MAASSLARTAQLLAEIVVVLLMKEPVDTELAAWASVVTSTDEAARGLGYNGGSTNAGGGGGGSAPAPSGLSDGYSGFAESTRSAGGGGGIGGKGGKSSAYAGGGGGGSMTAGNSTGTATTTQAVPAGLAFLALAE